MKRMLTKVTGGTLTVAMMMTMGSAVAVHADEKITVGYSLKTVQEERWQRELDGCEAAAADLGVDFV